MRRNKLKIAALAYICLLSAGLKVSAAEINVNDFDTLQNTIQNASSGSVLNITLTDNIQSASEIVTQKDSEVSISGGNTYSINSDTLNHRGFNVVNGSTLTISNTTVNNFLINQTSASQRDKGGAIYVSGQLDINNTDFVKNIALNGEQTSGTVVMGGAIYAKQGTVNINGGQFHENEARRGGAIASEDNSSAIFVIDSSGFVDNKAGFAGGAVSNGGVMSITNSNFKGNTADFSADTFENGGGAISNTGSLYLLGGNTFQQNISGRNGGAVLNRSNSGSNIIITDYAEFFGNEANVDTTKFEKTLNGGGAVFNGNKMTIGDNDLNSRINFTSNSTTASGGAIYNKKDMDINGKLYFATNSAGYSGGAIANAGTLTLNTGTSLGKFLENTSGGNGGAIANIGTLTIIGDTYYERNSADINGGAIYNTKKLIIDGTSGFVDNSSNGSGGAIFNQGELTISGTATFQNNSSNGSNSAMAGQPGGGAIYNSSILNISGTRNGDVSSADASIRFLNNSVANTNKSSTGGAIHVGANMYLTGADFIGNSAVRGGAIRGEGGGAGDDLILNDAKFLNNVAERYGGAISSAGTANIYVSNSYFEGNKVTDKTNGGMGGAITNGGNLTILNSTFKNNSAANHGGAVSFNGNKLSILADGADTVFTGNNNTNEGLYIYSTTKPVINFNAGNGSNIRFDDKIVSSVTQNIDLNKDNIYYNHFEDLLAGLPASTLAPVNGNIIFNNNVKNVNLTLYNGTLKIGDDSSILASGENYFTNSSLTLNGGTLDLANGNIESGDKLKLNNFVVNGDSNLQLDVNLSANGGSGEIDYINSDIKGSGTLTIDKINFEGGLSGDLGVSKELKFAKSNSVSTSLLNSLQTVITSDAGYGLDLTTTNSGKDTLSVTKVVNRGGLPIAVSIGDKFGSGSSTYVYSATSDETIDDWAIEYSYIDNSGIVQSTTASNILKGNELVINGNSYSVITTASDLAGIVLNNGQTLSVNNVMGWEGFASAVINNGGTVNIQNSTFSNNVSASGNGGAVQNLANGILNINNSTFENNSAVQGGAIYNEGTVNISADNSTEVVFSGNSTDVHNEGGTLNLTADKTSSITFNDKITGNNGTINITASNFGSIIFNNTVSNSQLTLNSGTMQIGKDTSQLAAGDKYFDNVALTVNDGTLSLQNGQIDTIDVTDFIVNNSSQFLLDINLTANQQSDKINANTVGGSGTIWIGPVNITEKMADGTTSIYADFINQNVSTAIEDVNKTITVDGTIYSVDVAGNRITVAKEGESGGFAYEVINPDPIERTFIIGSNDVTVNSWINGDNNLAGVRFQITGGSNGNSLIGSDIEGIIVKDGQQLDIASVSSYEGFKSAAVNNGGVVNISSTKFQNNSGAENGGVIRNNSGTVSIDGGSSFINNSADENGGAIYNNGTLNINTFATAGTFVGDIVFENNTAKQGSDIYQTASGITNITGDNGGKLALNGGIAGLGVINKSGNGTLVLNGDNSAYNGKFIQTGAVNDEGEAVTSGKTTVNSGAKFFNGQTTITDSTLEWLTSEDLDYTQAQKPKLTINSGNLIVGNSAKLTIDNGGSIADSVAVELNGDLILKEDMSVNGNISGTGNLTADNIALVVEGDNSGFDGNFIQNEGTTDVNDGGTLFSNVSLTSSVLNFNEGSKASSTSVFKSTDSTVSLISNSANSDTILNAVKNGTNSNLNIVINNTDTAEDLNIDGTGIAGLTFKNTSEYSGIITGTGDIKNEGALSVKGDESGFTGIFTQTDGSTTVDKTGKVFGGDKNIQAGSLNITSSNVIDYTNVHLSSGTKLNHTTETTAQNTVSSSVVDFVSDAQGASANFSASGVTGNYLITENIDNGKSNTISFSNSNVTLGTTDFTGNTTYNLTDSTLDLSSDSSIDNYEFSNLTTSGTNKLNFNANFVDTADPNVKAVETDTLYVASGNAEFEVGKVFISGQENGQAEYNTTQNVLSGNAHFSDDKPGEVVISTGATTSYEYEVTVTDDKQSVKLGATGISNENSLYEINKLEGNRFFQFSVGDTAEYHIGQSLTPTAKGDFYISGRSNKASESILSGAIVDSSGKLTGDKGSLFNIADNVKTNLELSDLTIQDAYKSGNGSVIENNSKDAVITLDNTIIKNNSSTGSGGAIYNDGGKILITGTTFTNNKADVGGGAIFNASGDLSLNNVTFNVANKTTGAKNDIYNAGSIVTSGKNTFASDITNDGSLSFAGTNNVSGNIIGADTGKITNTGTLNLKGDNSGYKGTFTQSAGSTTVNDKFFSGTSTISNGTLNWYTSKDLPSDGTLIVQNGRFNIGKNGLMAVLTLKTGSSIADKTAVTLNKDAKLNIDGADVSLNNNDNWVGNITLSDGNLTLNGLNSNGIITAEGGNLNLNSGNLYIASKSLIAGDGNNPAVTIADNANLNITGGNVTLNSNDTWKGNVNMVSGELNIDNIASNGKIQAAGGDLNINNGTLTVENGSFITSEVNAYIDSNSTIDIKDKGIVNINDGDSWNGNIALNGGVLNYGTTNSGTLAASTGDLNLLSGSILNIQTPSQVANEVNVDIQKGATVNLINNSIFNLDSKDKWNGMINNDGGKLTTTELVNKGGGGLQQISGESVFDKNSHISITDPESYIQGGKVSILNNSSLYMGPNVEYELQTNELLMSNNSSLYLINNVLEEPETDIMTVNGLNNVTIDIAPRGWDNDKFIINSLKSDSSGVLNISDFNFIGLAPIDRHIMLQVFDADSIKDVNFTATDKEIFTPIGWYNLRPAGGGYYTSNLTRYNPQVFRGQVATLAMYNNQLVIDDMLLNHVSLQSERFLAQGQDANKYAAVLPQFAPYQYKKEDGGLWFKSYATFETLSMTHNLNVGNNAYGYLMGADFPAVDLKNGWKFLPTAYIAYNGGHQYFNQVSMYQNGGQGGFMGTFMKNDFIGSILAYGGGYFNEMNVAGYTDNTGNWFAGTAAKLAYNIHATKHFTIQPTAFVSYNIFGKQNWGTDFGAMSMNSGYLNGVNVAPGLNLIYARETWSLYGTLQYIFNINDQIVGRAGNVNLSNIEMRHGYLQYGIGATKTWKDRLNAYLQITIRNGGRTGIGFQLGAQYLFDWYNPKSNKNSQKNSQTPAKKVLKTMR